jgi:hypothetical protein
MQKSSCVSPDYMALQFDLNEKMRAILIDWLIEVNNSALDLLLYISLESLFIANLHVNMYGEEGFISCDKAI